MYKKTAGIVLAAVLLGACGVEDKNKDVLFTVSDLADEEMRQELTDERISGLLKEAYPEESVEEVLSIELTNDTDGTEVFAITETDKETIFRTFERDGEEIIPTWEKKTPNVEETHYYVDSIMPDVSNKRNIVVVGIHRNPNMFLNYFLVGHLDDPKKIGILYDNEFEEAAPVFKGEVEAGERLLSIKSDGVSQYYLKLEGTKIIKQDAGS